MPLYISIQSTYEQIEIALCAGNLLLAKTAVHKFNASSELISAIKALLRSHARLFSEVQFIVINQGPGPFTTLRVAISTINGIAFASGIPLVGVKGLPAFISEFQEEKIPVTVALLNAFNKDLYFAIAKKNDAPVVGVENYQMLFDRIQKEYPQIPIQFIGNGVTLFKTEIMDQFKNYALLPEPFPAFTSIEHIAKIGFAQWQEKLGITNQIFPDYLKNYSAIIRYP